MSAGIFLYMKKLTQGQKKVKAREDIVFRNEVFLSKLAEIKKIENIKERMSEAKRLAEEYSINFAIGSRLNKEVCHPGFKKFELKSYEADVCFFHDELNDKKEEIYAYLATGEIQEPSEVLKKYPIHLCISPMASKRDVLDYISKNWQSIKAHLRYYDKQVPVYREPMNKERDDYIWENKDLPGKELAEKVNEKFPGNNFTYADINKILHKLRKLRLSEKV